MCKRANNKNKALNTIYDSVFPMLLVLPPPAAVAMETAGLSVF